MTQEHILITVNFSTAIPAFICTHFMHNTTLLIIHPIIEKQESMVYMWAKALRTFPPYWKMVSLMNRKTSSYERTKHDGRNGTTEKGHDITSRGHSDVYKQELINYAPKTPGPP